MASRALQFRHGLKSKSSKNRVAAAALLSLGWRIELDVHFLKCINFKSNFTNEQQWTSHSIQLNFKISIQTRKIISSLFCNKGKYGFFMDFATRTQCLKIDKNVFKWTSTYLFEQQKWNGVDPLWSLALPLIHRFDYRPISPICIF